MRSVAEVKKKVDYLLSEIEKVIVGQQEMIKQVIIALLTNSNVLVEGYPGLAKTMTVKTIASLMDLKFCRVQGTPDLMPSDITGTYIIEDHSGKREFKFQPGPIFANIILMDEVNRATPKTQSALLEAMQEKQVTVGNSTFKLDEPFFVLATQNPIEQEGTYPLPEAQQDRFLFKVKISYPTNEEEYQIIDRFTASTTIPHLRPVIRKEELIDLQDLVRKVPISNDLKKEVVKIINNTRNKKDLIEYGASPRASIGLVLASKARALIEGRSFVNKEDIEKMAYPILRHRIILSFEAEKNNMTPDDVIKLVLK